MGLVASKDTEQAHHRDDKETVKKNGILVFSVLTFFSSSSQVGQAKKGGRGGAERERDIHNAFNHHGVGGVRKRHGI